jgi:hypothetical protein
LPILNYDWMLYIWAVIYAYQILWVMFTLTLVCRRGRYGHLYTNPPIVSVDIYVLFTISLCGTVAGLFLWDESLVRYTILSNLVTTVFSYLSLLVSFRGMKDHGMELIVAKNVSHLWDIVLLLQNGLAAHASWQTVNLMYLSTVALTSTSQILTKETGSYGFQGALMLYTVLFFALDTFCTKGLNGYLLTPYIISVLAFTIIAIRNTGDPQQNYHYYIACALVGLAFIMFVIKLVVIIVRHRKRAEQSRLAGGTHRVPGTRGSRKTSTGAMYFPGMDTASSIGGHSDTYDHMYSDEGTILK